MLFGLVSRGCPRRALHYFRHRQAKWFGINQAFINSITSRHLSTISMMPPSICEGQDAHKVMTEAEALLERGWKIDDDEMGVEKRYYFKTYSKALVRGSIRSLTALADTLHDFLSVIGIRSKSKNHHPVMSIVRSISIHSVIFL